MSDPNPIDIAAAWFRHVADRDIEIPPASEFPHEGFDTREDMVERYRKFGTLLTVGVAP